MALGDQVRRLSGACLLRPLRRFNNFTDLCAGIEFSTKARHAALNGEIVCLDDNGHSQFNELLFHCGPARFCAFDLLHLDGKEMRHLAKASTLLGRALQSLLLEPLECAKTASTARERTYTAQNR